VVRGVVCVLRGLVVKLTNFALNRSSSGCGHSYDWLWIGCGLVVDCGAGSSAAVVGGVLVETWSESRE